MKKALFLTSTCLLLGWGNVGVANPTAVDSEPSTQTQKVVSKEMPQESAEPFSVEADQPQASPEPEVGESVGGHSAPMVDVGSPLQFKTVNDDIPVELVERGAQPRRKLRFRSEEGEIQRFKMQMTMTTDVKLNGRKMPAFAIPAIEMTGVAETTQVDRKGQTYMTFKYEEPKILEAENGTPFFGEIMKSVLQKQFKQLTGSQMNFVYDKRGQLKEMDIEFAGEPDPATAKLLKQFSGSAQQSSGVFPKKSVGVGAIWSAPQKISLQGMDLSQSITYELLEMTEEQVKVGMEFVFEDGSQSFGDLFNSFPVPEGAELDVSVFEMSGDGTMTMNLSQLLATDMDMTTDARVLMKMTSEDRPDMVMEMDMTSRVKIILEE